MIAFAVASDVREMKVKRSTSNRYVVEAVDRALDLLEVFRDSEDLSLNELCKRAGQNKSRTFRLLHTLARRGYVERAADGQRFKLGLKLFEHATHFRRDVKQIAQPFMRQLHRQFNETINLAVIHNGEVLYIDLLESSRTFRMSAMIGSRMPVASTSLGKAMMSYGPENERESLLRQLPSPQARRLRQELETVRQRGYALDREENEPGVACVGAPIFDGRGGAVAAMSVSGPVARMVKQEKQIGATLVEICGEISRYMGFVGGLPGRSSNEAKAFVRASGSA